MPEHPFFKDYFAQYQKLAFDEAVYARLEQLAELALTVKKSGNKLMFGGNGASAAASSHASVDFTKQGGVRALAFHDPSLITCFANDYGYAHWLAKAVEHHGDDGDAVVLISVSGESPSVVNAARYARSRKMPVVAFSGRRNDNALTQLADINFWVDSDAYNVVENIHGIWLTAAIDYVIGKAVYETRADAAI